MRVRCGTYDKYCILESNLFNGFNIHIILEFHPLNLLKLESILIIRLSDPTNRVSSWCKDDYVNNAHANKIDIVKMLYVLTYHLFQIIIPISLTSEIIGWLVL